MSNRYNVPQFAAGESAADLPRRRTEVRTLDSFGFERIDFIDAGGLPRYLHELGYEMHRAGFNLLCIPVESSREYPLEGTEPLPIRD